MIHILLIGLTHANLSRAQSQISNLINSSTNNTTTNLVQSSNNENDNISSSKDDSKNKDKITMYTATSLSEIRDVFAQASRDNFEIEHVFMGAGIDIDKRVELVKAVVAFSGSGAHVHLKNGRDGPEGFPGFVLGSVAGFV